MNIRFDNRCRIEAGDVILFPSELLGAVKIQAVLAVCTDHCASIPSSKLHKVFLTAAEAPITMENQMETNMKTERETIISILGLGFRI